MNWLDAAFIIILVLTALVGLWKGLIKLVFAFVAMILGLILAGYAGVALGNAFGGGAVATVVSFAILFIVIALAIYLILTRMVRRFITWGPMALIDRLGGLAFGVAIGFAMCGTLSPLLGIAAAWDVLANRTEATGRITNLLEGSALVPAVDTYFTWLAKMMPNVFDKVTSML